MVDKESTHHYWRTLGEFGESGEVHPSLADLYHLLLAFALVVRVGCLPWKDLRGWGQSLMKWDGLPQLKQR
jgi:hypothetical protein